MRDRGIHGTSRPRRIWRCAPWSTNSLMRTSDRFLAALAISAVVAALMAIPLAATVGTSVYASDRERSEQQHNTYDRWNATVTTSSPANPATKDIPTGQKVVTWAMNGTERTEPLIDHFSARPGQTITVWTNSDGEQVRAPMETSLAAVDGIAAAVLLCCATIFGLFLTVRIAQAWITHRNLNTWEKEWRDIVTPHPS